MSDAPERARSYHPKFQATPTCEIRFRIITPTSMRLEQKWVDGYGTEVWMDVPYVDVDGNLIDIDAAYPRRAV